MMKLDANYLILSSRRNHTMNKWITVSMFLVMDSVVFFLALVGGYFIINSGSLTGISSLLITAYSRIIITAWMLFLVSLNLFSVYRPSHILSNRRVLLGVAGFWAAVLGLSAMYPNLRFSVNLSFWASLIMAALLVATRHLAKRFL